MNEKNDFIDRLERHEEEGTPLSNEDESWFENLKSAARASGELSIKEDLDGYYKEHKKAVRVRTIKLTSMSVAASVVIGLTIFYNTSSPDGGVNLIMEEQPIYSDSASYDSTRKENIQEKIKKDVDDESQQ